MSTVEGAGVYPALENRPLKGTICLFDVDNTLTPARRVSAAYWTLYSESPNADKAPELLARHRGDAPGAFAVAAKVCHWLR
jgi:hypothetical protein